MFATTRNINYKVPRAPLASFHNAHGDDEDDSTFTRRRSRHFWRRCRFYARSMGRLILLFLFPLGAILINKSSIFSFHFGYICFVTLLLGISFGGLVVERARLRFLRNKQTATGKSSVSPPFLATLLMTTALHLMLFVIFARMGFLAARQDVLGVAKSQRVSGWDEARKMMPPQAAAALGDHSPFGVDEANQLLGSMKPSSQVPKVQPLDESRRQQMLSDHGDLWAQHQAALHQQRAVIPQREHVASAVQTFPDDQLDSTIKADKRFRGQAKAVAETFADSTQKSHLEVHQKADEKGDAHFMKAASKALSTAGENAVRQEVLQMLGGGPVGEGLNLPDDVWSGTYYKDDAERRLHEVWDNSTVLPISQEDLDSMTPQEIVAAHEKHFAKAPISIVLASHNEQQYITRTLESILNSTLPGVLREIIILDDGSEPPMGTSYNTSLYSPPLVRLIRNEQREGLIRSKNFGGNFSMGSVIVFLDAHIRPDPHWWKPILKHINFNYKRVVVPMIPILNGETWVVDRGAIGQKMMFDWDLGFHWFIDDNDWVPCMSGGLLAISKEWWHESGELDMGMYVWGGENIEQSVRIWLCGGEIVVARDSLIAHVFRPTFPYSINVEKVMDNKIRTVEAWFDEYKTYFYKASPAAFRRKPKVHVPYIGEGYTVDPSYDQSTGVLRDIDDRLRLRRVLQCKPFQNYVNQFHEVFRDRLMLPIEAFQLRNPTFSRCITPDIQQWEANALSVKDKQPVHLKAEYCSEVSTNDEEQPKFWWSLRENSQFSLESLRTGICLDAAIGKMPLLWQTHFLHPNVPFTDVVSLRHFPEVYACSSTNVNQKHWSYDETTKHIRFGTSACLRFDRELLMVSLSSDCTSRPEELIWNIENKHAMDPVTAKKIRQVPVHA